MFEYVVETIHKELRGTILAAVPVRIGHQLLRLGSEHCRTDGRQYVLKHAAKPHVKVIGKIRIADVVVIRRVGGYHHIGIVPGRRIRLMCLTQWRCGHILHGLGNPFHLTEEIA